MRSVRSQVIFSELSHDRSHAQLSWSFGPSSRTFVAKSCGARCMQTDRDAVLTYPAMLWLAGVWWRDQRIAFRTRLPSVDASVA